MKSNFKLSITGKSRMICRRVLFSSVMSAGLTLPVSGQKLEFYEPNVMQGLHSSITYMFADIDNDGDLDAFNGNIYFENTGSSTEPDYKKRMGTLNPVTSLPNTDLIFVDIDADDDLDVFIGSIKEAGSWMHLRYYENIGSAASAQYIEKDTSQFGEIHDNDVQGLTFVDIDTDGDQDVFLSEFGFLENTGTEEIPFFIKKEGGKVTELNILTSDRGRLPGFIDIDHDGDLDALFPTARFQIGDDIDGRTGLAGLIYAENTGTPNNPIFTSSFLATTFYWNDLGINRFLTIDIDDDADLDLAINGITILNNGSSGFKAFDFSRLQIPLGMSFADLDDDNDLDAFFLSRYYDDSLYQFDHSVRQYTNEGDMHFTMDSITWVGEESAYIGELVDEFAFNNWMIDLDQDGDLDQLLLNMEQSFRFFKNIGSAEFPGMEEQFGVDNPFSSLYESLSELISPEPKFVDIDGDGDFDIFIFDIRESDIRVPFPLFTHRKEIIFFENIGNAEVPVYQRDLPENHMLPTIYGVDSFSFSDVDLDGDQDLLLDNGQLIFLENVGDKQAPDFIFTKNLNSPFKNVFKDDSRPYSVEHLQFVDLDQNGYDDLIIDDNLLFLSRVIEQQDTDIDGLPDDWEIMHELNPDDKGDALLDNDGDGYSNLEEFNEGTNPKDPVDYPGSSPLEPCNNYVRPDPDSYLLIDNEHYSSSDDINCTASTIILLERDVSFSSGTHGDFVAPIIHLMPNVTIPQGANVTFVSQYEW